MDDFARRLLDWFDRDGRKDLPWQHEATPYRVWISEVMLQQTQVATVIPYFERFIASFPELTSLADADEEAVLAHWSGLGYYSRARNLHRAACLIRDEHSGRFPTDIDELVKLPGIGRSTAGAILSLSLGQRQPILDGNVKRVLCRFHAVEGWPGKRAVEQRLWQLAETHTPLQRNANYTQAIMDLGATLCTRTRPQCEECPFSRECQAFKLNKQTLYPESKPRKEIPRRNTSMLIISNEVGEVLLEKRPPAGIWGGLWSLPECPGTDELIACCQEKWGVSLDSAHRGELLRHSFSHFHLDIMPIYIRVNGAENSKVMEPGNAVWYNSGSFHRLGLPAPVKQLLDNIDTGFEE